MDIREILRRLCEHHSDRIAKDLKINRCIIQRYRAWAVDENLLTDELPINAYLDNNFEAWLKRSSQ